MAETAVAGRWVSETCFRYSPKLRNQNEEIANLLVGLTEAR
jgi:putative transposase